MCIYDFTPYIGCLEDKQHYYVQWMKCNKAMQINKYCSFDKSVPVEELRKISGNVLSCPVHRHIAIQQHEFQIIEEASDTVSPVSKQDAGNLHGNTDDKTNPTAEVIEVSPAEKKVPAVVELEAPPLTAIYLPQSPKMFNSPSSPKPPSVKPSSPKLKAEGGTNTDPAREQAATKDETIEDNKKSPGDVSPTSSLGAQPPTAPLRPQSTLGVKTAEERRRVEKGKGIAREPTYRRTKSSGTTDETFPKSALKKSPPPPTFNELTMPEDIEVGLPARPDIHRRPSVASQHPSDNTLSRSAIPVRNSSPPDSKLPAPPSPRKTRGHRRTTSVPDATGPPLTHRRSEAPRRERSQSAEPRRNRSVSVDGTHSREGNQPGTYRRRPMRDPSPVARNTALAVLATQTHWESEIARRRTDNRGYVHQVPPSRQYVEAEPEPVSDDEEGEPIPPSDVDEGGTTDTTTAVQKESPTLGHSVHFDLPPTPAPLNVKRESGDSGYQSGRQDNPRRASCYASPSGTVTSQMSQISTPASAWRGEYHDGSGSIVVSAGSGLSKRVVKMPAPLQHHYPMAVSKLSPRPLPDAAYLPVPEKSLSAKKSLGKLKRMFSRKEVV